MWNFVPPACCFRTFPRLPLYPLAGPLIFCLIVWCTDSAPRQHPPNRIFERLSRNFTETGILYSLLPFFYECLSKTCFQGRNSPGIAPLCSWSTVPRSRTVFRVPFSFIIFSYPRERVVRLELFTRFVSNSLHLLDACKRHPVS